MDMNFKTNDIRPSGGCDPQNEEDKAFRRKNIWHSFLAAMYSIVGGAATYGLLNNLVASVAHPAAVVGGAVTTGAAATGTLGILLSPAVLIPAFIIGGIICTYLAQKEYTELRCLQDDNLARRNAVHMATYSPQKDSQQKEVPQPISVNAEYHQNQRSDGKSWEDVVMANARQVIIQAAQKT